MLKFVTVSAIGIAYCFMVSVFVSMPVSAQDTIAYTYLENLDDSNLPEYNPYARYFTELSRAKPFSQTVRNTRIEISRFLSFNSVTTEQELASAPVDLTKYKDLYVRITKGREYQVHELIGTYYEAGDDEKKIVKTEATPQSDFSNLPEISQIPKSLKSLEIQEETGENATTLEPTHSPHAIYVDISLVTSNVINKNTRYAFSDKGYVRIYTEEFTYSTRGNLLKHVRNYVSGAQQRSLYFFGNVGIKERFWKNRHGREFLVTYGRNGEVLTREEWNKGKPHEQLTNRYEDGQLIEQSIVQANTKTILTYQNGIVIARRVYKDDVLVREDLSTYRDVEGESLLEKNLQNTDLKRVEVVRVYEGTELVREDHYHNDNLVRRVHYSEGDKRMVELFRNEKKVLELTYKDGDLVSEKVIR